MVVQRSLVWNIPKVSGPGKRGPIGTTWHVTANHTQRVTWYKSRWYNMKPDIQFHHTTPRILLDRDLLPKERWSFKKNMPDVTRWETVVNSARTTEDRWALVEEDGFMHKVNWSMYSQRLKTEMESTRENIPQYTYKAVGVPMDWKGLDVQITRMKGLSVREAMAQCKLSNRKGHTILNHCLEASQQGAENKGLDKEKLRIVFMTVWPGATDAAIDIRAKGYYGWKSKKSSNILVRVAEDPEMVLPDRTSLPFSSVLALRKAGLYEEPTVLDVPAITAEGI